MGIRWGEVRELGGGWWIQPFKIESLEADMDRNELNKRFDHHAPPNVLVESQHSEVRSILKDAATQLAQIVPAGREQSVVFTKLEEAMMWANAGIARASRAESDV